jgi:preprotein translocase subunit SecA
MSGTVSEIADELNATYGLITEIIPTNQPTRREQLSPQIFVNNTEKYQYLLASLEEKYKLGQPVLVGTRSIADSQALSMLLENRGIEHKVLNAVQDLEEAEIVSQAGQLSQITVATNMAGRGTDIKLSAAAKELGGLHVICSEPHDSGRIDRQLFGRCARQGDPGSYQLLCSFEDEIPRRFLSGALINIGQRLLRIKQPWSQRLVLALISYAQARAEKRNYLMRYDLAQMDDRINKSLGFSGIIE